MSDERKAGWIGVDLDGTLAEYNGWIGPDHIGPPIPAMVNRVTQWRAEGREVRIFTARYYKANIDVRLAIERWSEEHLGEILPVTCTKDYGMIELWDDRCVQVIPNTGEPVVRPKPRPGQWVDRMQAELLRIMSAHMVEAGPPLPAFVIRLSTTNFVNLRRLCAHDAPARLVRRTDNGAYEFLTARVHAVSEDFDYWSIHRINDVGPFADELARGDIQ